MLLKGRSKNHHGDADDMTLKLYGSLKDSVAIPCESMLQSPISVSELVRKMDIPRSAVKMVMINCRPARPGEEVAPGDSVALFPMEYPFFADWKDFWREFAE